MSLIPAWWRQYSPMRRREAIAGFLFVLPWIIGLLVFNLYPVLSSFYLSFTNYSVLEEPKWIWFENYQSFVNDPSMLIAIQNSAIYALLSVPIGLAASLGLALVLNMRAAGIGIYRTLFYLPSVVPPVAGAIVFMILFEPRSGLVNTLLRGMGLPAPAWFADPVWAKPGLIILSLWSIGSSTLIFLAGLQEIPSNLLEAASIDGAGPWQKFRHITLPMLSPVILFNLVMGVIYSFQVFTQAMVIGGTSGDPVESTLVIMVQIYRSAFRYFKMGYASAQAVILFLAVLSVTLVIFRTSRLWVFSESDEQNT